MELYFRRSEPMAVPFDDRAQHQPPGIDGTYSGSCVVCLQGCDTALAFRGEAEWIIAGLRVLGLPSGEAEQTLAHATGCDPDMVPNGELTVPVRVCESCVQATGTGMRVGLAVAEVPIYQHSTR
jgi:hypothetical protein